MKPSNRPGVATPVDRLLCACQRLLPQHAVSRLVYRITRIRAPVIKDTLIRLFVNCYAVELDEAAPPAGGRYTNFNAFFTRALIDGARPLPDEPDAIACPVDGTVSQIGTLDGTMLVQAKGQAFSAGALLGGSDRLAARFAGGSHATLYLSPRNYHRVHMPLDGRLTQVLYVPGALFPVNERATRSVDRLFARNERVISVFQTAAGEVALVMVGALFVGSMELNACVLPDHTWRKAMGASIAVDVDQAVATSTRGQEIGRFNMGSTVILLFQRDSVRWRPELGPGDPVRMGQPIGRFNPDRDTSRQGRSS